MLKEISDKTEFNQLANHITQTWEWGEFRAKTSTIKKVLRLGSYVDGKLVRVFQVIFSKVPKLSNTVAYLPRSEFPNKEELIEIKKYCKKEKAIFIKFEPVKLTTDYRILTTAIKGDSILPQHTIYIDLTLTVEKLLANMHEKTRYNIRLSQKKGVVVREENSTEGLEKFITILEATEKRQGFFSHDSNYYRTLWKTLGSHKIIHILNAYSPNNQETPIASIMLFHHKNFLYYPYGGSDSKFREFMAPQLLHWEAIKLGKNLGAKTYDLWGSYKHKKEESDPFWGIYRLKSGFGGKDIDYPDSIDIPISPLYPLFIMANKIRWLFLKKI